MAAAVFFLFCSLVGVTARKELALEADRPFVRVKVFDQATLECCYKHGPKTPIWIKRNSTTGKFLPVSDSVDKNYIESGDKQCGTLTFKSVQLLDSGMYQCWLNQSKQITHGTYLQVYQPMKKTINLSESTKNTILTVEGVLLLLCVLVPSTALLLKSNRVNKLEIKKMKREEENIYQGLNLDDCCTTYDQIERSQAQGPYQDVGITEEADEIQLEKP